MTKIMEKSDFSELMQAGMQEKKEDKRRNLPHLFKKGQSGNPAGKPKGTISIISELKKKLKEMPPGEEKRTYLDIFILKILKKALNDEDVKMMIEIMRYIDGMPKQNVELKGDVNMTGMTREEIVNNIVAILNEYENK